MAAQNDIYPDLDTLMLKAANQIVATELMAPCFVVSGPLPHSDSSGRELTAHGEAGLDAPHDTSWLRPDKCMVIPLLAIVQDRHEKDQGRHRIGARRGRLVAKVGTQRWLMVPSADYTMAPSLRRAGFHGCELWSGATVSLRTSLDLTYTDLGNLMLTFVL